MTPETCTIAAIAFVCRTAAAAPLVTYESPCECRDYHGKGRLTEKNDTTLPPTDPNAMQAVTPSDIFSWQGPTEQHSYVAKVLRDEISGRHWNSESGYDTPERRFPR
jgi:hypothetical protein